MLKVWEYVHEVNFSTLNSQLLDTPMGESKRLKKAMETFLKHWHTLRKKIETEPTFD
tara:strand:+ start:126 stop:296 length:171 start_codon:yes stop_codon:yes gene_type:complete